VSSAEAVTAAKSDVIVASCSCYGWMTVVCNQCKKNSTVTRDDLVVWCSLRYAVRSSSFMSINFSSKAPLNGMIALPGSCSSTHSLIFINLIQSTIMSLSQPINKSTNHSNLAFSQHQQWFTIICTTRLFGITINFI